jgi:hypothetical protein
METDGDNNDFSDELSGISARTLLRRLKTSQILKGNEILKQQERALDEELLTDKQALKEVEDYANALGNPNIIDNILLDKTTFELEALNISYPFKVPIPEELKNAL